MAHRRSLIPTLPTAIATLYSVLAHAGGLALLCRPRPLDVALGVCLVSHARVVAAVLVHDATHEAVIRRGLPNAVAGTLLLWLAGCPYCYFPRVQRVHIAHHRDRADTVDFDYRAYIGCRPMLKTFVIACETLFVPAVELLMHARCAFSPLLWPQSELHRLNSVVGIGAVAYLCSRLYEAGGCVAPLAWFVTTCILIHVLNYHDAFAHTYIVVDADAPGYRPGPMDRTAAYEEENTYSTVISTRWPSLNLLTLYFGLHNAHHRSTGTAWHQLPALHSKLYGSDLARCPAVLTWAQLSGTWVGNRLRRVLEEDYGVVHKGGLEPARVKDFVGTLGVSFLTI